MSKTLLPGGLYGKFDLKEDGWNDEVNQNFELLAALIGGCVTDMVAALPTLGNDGDKYIDTTSNELAVWYCNKWNKFPLPCGWTFKSLADGLFYYYDENGVIVAAPAGGGGGGTPDDLGNHSATEDLLMNAFSIVNVDNIDLQTLEANQRIAMAPGGFERFTINNSGGFAAGYRSSGVSLSSNKKTVYGIDTNTNNVVLTLSDFDKAEGDTLKAPLIWVKDETGNASVNNINIIAQSGSIDGVPGGPYVIDQDYKAVAFYTDGANWFTLNHIEPAAVPGGSSAGFVQIQQFASHFNNEPTNNLQLYRGIGFGGNSNANMTFTPPEFGLYKFDFHFQYRLRDISPGRMEAGFGLLHNIADTGGVLVTYTNADVVVFDMKQEENVVTTGQEPIVRGSITQFKQINTIAPQTVRPVFAKLNSSANIRFIWESGLESQLVVTKV